MEASGRGSGHGRAGRGAAGMAFATLQEEVLDIMRHTPEGVTNEQLKAHFGDRFHSLAPVVNALLESRRIALYSPAATGGGGASTLMYRLVSEETVAGLDGLGPEQILVYQICEKAGNKGIWMRDIKSQTNIPQQTLTKTLKILEQRNLIKNVRSVVSKTKKFYMLFSATPAKELTGGPWYTDQEFDHAFVEDLCKMIIGIVKQQTVSDAGAILSRLVSTGIIEAGCLSLEDVETVMQMLVFDGRLEEATIGHAGAPGGGVSGSTEPASATDDGGGRGSIAPPRLPPRYKMAKEFSSYNHLTETPCGVCPVISQCSEGGLISPATCPYMSDWLAEGGGGASSGLLDW